MDVRQPVAIDGFDHYEVTEAGEVFNTITGRKLTDWKNEHSYHRVSLTSREKKKQHFYVHRIVAFTFHVYPGDGYEVHHKDRDRSNNHKTNVEWVTRAENMAFVHSKDDLGEFADPIENGDDLPF